MCCFVWNMNENEDWGMQGPVVGLEACAAEMRQRILLPKSEDGSWTRSECTCTAV